MYVGVGTCVWEEEARKTTYILAKQEKARKSKVATPHNQGRTIGQKRKERKKEEQRTRSRALRITLSLLIISINVLLKESVGRYFPPVCATVTTISMFSRGMITAWPLSFICALFLRTDAWGTWLPNTTRMCPCAILNRDSKAANYC